MHFSSGDVALLLGLGRNFKLHVKSGKYNGVERVAPAPAAPCLPAAFPEPAPPQTVLGAAPPPPPPADDDELVFAEDSLEEEDE